MAVRKPKRPQGKTLGALFADTLAIYEVCEAALGSETDTVTLVVETLGRMVEGTYSTIHDDADGAEFITNLASRWGNDARSLREAFKFRAKSEDLAALANEGVEPRTVLPFERVCLIVTDCGDINNFGDEAERLEKQFPGNTAMCVQEMVIYGETRTAPPSEGGALDQGYDDVGIEPGDTFVSLAFAFTAKMQDGGGLGGPVPVEVHVVHDRALAESVRWCLATPPGFPDSMGRSCNMLAEMAVYNFSNFLASLDARRATQLRLPGIRRMVKPGKKKRRKYEFYEHTLVIIDPHQSRPVAAEGGLSGRHHKLHPVIGFWRRKPKGGRTFVRAHWRGDKDLGVITHDYEIDPSETD
jgi:hypothetical protein